MYFVLYNFEISYSTIVLYSRDHKGVGGAHEETSPKNQPHFSQAMMRQTEYWLGKTMPKQAFRSTQKVFNKFSTSCFGILKKKDNLTEFCSD